MTKLEQVAEMYGMNVDYYDSTYCRIYKLSNAVEVDGNKNELLVPVVDALNDKYIGNVRIKNVCRCV